MLGAAALCGVVSCVFAQETADKPAIVRGNNAKFSVAPGLPDCVTIAPAHGDPFKGASAIILKVDSGCVVPWHWHTANESLVPLSGLMQLTAKGEKPQVVAIGDFAYMPTQHVHMTKCASTKPCTSILQVDAALDIHYVDKAGNEITPEAALADVNKPPTKPATKP